MKLFSAGILGILSVISVFLASPSFADSALPIIDLTRHANDEIAQAGKTGAKYFHQDPVKHLVQISTTEFEAREHGFFHMHTTRHWKSDLNMEVLLQIVPELEAAYKVTFKKRRPTPDDPFMKIYLYGEPVPCENSIKHYCEKDDFGRGVALPFKVKKICDAGFKSCQDVAK